MNLNFAVEIVEIIGAILGTLAFFYVMWKEWPGIKDRPSVKMVVNTIVGVGAIVGIMSGVISVALGGVTVKVIGWVIGGAIFGASSIGITEKSIIG